MIDAAVTIPLVCVNELLFLNVLKLLLSVIPPDTVTLASVDVKPVVLLAVPPPPEPTEIDPQTNVPVPVMVLYLFRFNSIMERPQ